MITEPLADSKSAIVANDLKKTYRQGWLGQKRFDALRGVSFEVPVGSIFGLLGPNGAGKTTFVKTLLGVIRKTGGSASIFGLPPGSWEAKKRIGYLPERLSIPSYLTGHQALTFYGGLSNLSASEIRKKREGLLKQVGLDGWGDSQVSKYSKGMVQRLGLAQALCCEPDLLVLDEPTDGLDPEARAGVRQILKDLSEKGVTIFLNSHLLQEVEMVCQKVAIMAEGTLRYCGDVDQVDAFLRKGETEKTNLVKFSLRLSDQQASKLQMPKSFQLREQSSHDKQEGVMNFMEEFDDPKGSNLRIDQLRSKGIEIVAVVPQRATLEEGFLKLVRTKEMPVAPVAGSGLTQAGKRS